MSIKRAGRSAVSVRSCRGLRVYRSPAFIRSSHAWVSAISVPENICGVLIPIIEKLSRIKQALEEARENPETCVVVYQDEFGFNLQPRVAKDWAETGTKCPLARQSYLPEESAMACSTHTPEMLFIQVKMHGCRTP